MGAMRGPVLLVPFLYLASLLHAAAADSILGCGGFVEVIYCPTPLHYLVLHFPQPSVLIEMMLSRFLSSFVFVIAICSAGFKFCSSIVPWMWPEVSHITYIALQTSTSLYVYLTIMYGIFIHRLVQLWQN
jgi:hypothetical protein